MILLVFLLLVVVTMWFFFIKPLSYWKNKRVKQSKPWPFFGDSWRVFIGKTSYLKYWNWIYDQGKGVRYFGFYEFWKPYLAIMDPELIKQVTVKEFDSFVNHNILYVDSEIDPYWGNNVLILRDEKWKSMRAALTPTYTGSKMRFNFEIMAETAESFISYFLDKNQDFIEVEMKDAYSRFTNDAIAHAAFGLKLNSLKDRNNAFYYHGLKITNLQTFSFGLKSLMLQLNPVLLKIFGLNVLGKEHTRYFHDVLFDTLKHREENNIIRPDLVNLLLDAKKARYNNTTGHSGKSMSDEEILAQALVFFFAGFETVATTLSWGSYELALNKEVQDKLREEIRETYGKHGKPSYDVIQDMRYLDMVVSETLRKWPPFMRTDRVVSKPFTIQPVDKNEEPVHLEPENVIFIPIFRLQRDPKYFPNPEKFDPERFSKENKHKITPYTYIPFGAGPRLCMGNRYALLEIKILLFNILLNFEIVPVKKTKISPKIVMSPFQYALDGGYWLGLKRLRN